MPLRGIRGATTVSANTKEEIFSAVRELLQAVELANSLDVEQVASAYFTVTPDLDAAFPAGAARMMGWQDVPLLDAQAPLVAGDLPHCIRVLIHWNTGRSQDEVRHIYLREARRLRPDRINGGECHGHHHEA